MNTATRSALAVGLVLGALGCDRPALLPDIALSAGSLSFRAPPGTDDPAAQVLYVTNAGDGKLARPAVSLAYTGTATGWLSATVAPASGAPYRVDVRAAVGGLQPGSYGATLTVSSENASSSPLQVPVTLEVPPPSFALSTSQLAFAAPRGGGDPAQQTVLVRNGGRGTLPVPRVATSYVGPGGWLSVEVGGTPAGYTVSARVSVTGLHSAQYSATVALDADGVAGPARTFGVSLVVPPPELALSATSVEFTGNADASDPAPVVVTVRNAGGGILAAPVVGVSYSDPNDPPWLGPELLGTEAPYTLTLRVHQERRTVLAKGVHRASVAVFASDSTDRVELEVAFDVPHQPPILGAWPAPVSFTRIIGCPVSTEPQTVQVFNTGPGVLARPNVSVDPAADWLEAKLVGAREPWRVEVRLKDAPPAGVTSATIRLDSPGAAGPLALEVTYAETAPFDHITLWVDPPALSFWAQRGLGDPGPRSVNVHTGGGCVPPPAVGVTFEPGVAPWLTLETRTSDRRHEIVVRADSTGLAPAETRRETLDFPFRFDSGQSWVEVALGAGDLQPTSSLAAARTGHTLTRLGNEVLAVGGRGGAVLSVAEIYEPGTRTWSPAGQLSSPRSEHGSAFVDMWVFVAGGLDSSGSPLSSCERYVPWQRSFEAAGFLLHPRVNPVIVPLPIQRALVVSADAPPEVRDVLNATSVAPQDVTVSFSGAVKLPDGRVLLAGGATTDAALYDPVWGEFTFTGPLGVARARPALAVLPDGRVLALGGDPQTLSAELWDPATGTWSPAAPSPSAHVAGDVVVLTNGKVLAIGGRIAGPAPVTADVELYDPGVDGWSVVGTLPPARSGARLVLLENGMVFLAGGAQGAGGDATAEAFTW